MSTAVFGADMECMECAPVDSSVYRIRQADIDAMPKGANTPLNQVLLQARGLWLLETIVTAAPLVGLLGTIAGMMHSFRLIGGDGLVNPAGVSGGVAQAFRKN